MNNVMLVSWCQSASVGRAVDRNLDPRLHAASNRVFEAPFVCGSVIEKSCFYVITEYGNNNFH